MRTLVIAALAATTVAFGALAQSQQGNAPSKSTSQSTNEQTGASGRSGSGDSVSVRAKVRTGSSHRLVTREHSSGGTAVIHKRTRTHVVATDDRPSMTVIKKKKKYAKKKHTRIYASVPSTRMTVIEKRRRGIVASGGVTHTRTVKRSSTGSSVGVRTGGSSRASTTGSASRSGSENSASGTMRAKAKNSRSGSSGSQSSGSSQQ